MAKRGANDQDFSFYVRREWAGAGKEPSFYLFKWFKYIFFLLFVVLWAQEALRFDFVTRVSEV